LQRGGTPTYFDRVLASKMGVGAVEGLIQGNHSSMVGIKNNQIVYNGFETIINSKHEIDTESLRIAKILSI
jgi:6-phosphofructokinase 1